MKKSNLTTMLRAILRNAGFHPARLAAATRGWRRYVEDRERFRALSGEGGMPWDEELPMLMEREDVSGSVGPYFLQDQRVAGWIHDANPRLHVDVGSRIDGFIGSVSVFRKVEVIDIRPQPAEIPNVTFHRIDLTGELPAEWIARTDSLSCLHTIEHFGLGRYGDGIDPEGHLKGLAQMKRMVAPGGVFYLSTPVGPERVVFNAHRVFAPRTVIDWFSDGWTIERGAVIDDDDRIREAEGVRVLQDFEGRTGVGIVKARKK